MALPSSTTDPEVKRTGISTYRIFGCILTQILMPLGYIIPPHLIFRSNHLLPARHLASSLVNIWFWSMSLGIPCMGDDWNLRWLSYPVTSRIWTLESSGTKNLSMLPKQNRVGRHHSSNAYTGDLKKWAASNNYVQACLPPVCHFQQSQLRFHLPISTCPPLLFITPTNFSSSVTRSSHQRLLICLPTEAYPIDPSALNTAISVCFHQLISSKEIPTKPLFFPTPWPAHQP